MLRNERGIESKRLYKDTRSGYWRMQKGEEKRRKQGTVTQYLLVHWLRLIDVLRAVLVVTVPLNYLTVRELLGITYPLQSCTTVFLSV
jgi:hypothetical protein